MQLQQVKRMFPAIDFLPQPRQSKHLQAKLCHNAWPAAQADLHRVSQAALRLELHDPKNLRTAQKTPGDYSRPAKFGSR